MGSFDQACPSFGVQNSNTAGSSGNVCSGRYVKDPDLQAWINENDPTCRLQKVYSFANGWQWSFIVTGQGGSTTKPPTATDIAFLWHPTKLTLSQKLYADLEPQNSWGTNDFTAIGAGVPAAGGVGAALTFPLLSDQISTIDITTSYVRNSDFYLSVFFETGDCDNGVAQPPFQTHTKWDFADSLLDKDVTDAALRAALTDLSGDDIDQCTSTTNSNARRWYLRLERENSGDSATIRTWPPRVADTSAPKISYNFDGTGPINSAGMALDFDYCPSPFAKDPAMRAKTSFAEGESVELEYDYAFTGVNAIEGVAKVNLLFENWQLGWISWTKIHSSIRNQLDARQDPAVPDDPATDPRPTMGKSWMLPGINLATTHDSNCPTESDWTGTGLTVIPIAETNQAPSGITATAGASPLPTEQQAPFGVLAEAEAPPTEAQAPTGITAAPAPVCAGGGLYSPGSAAEFGFVFEGGPAQNASPQDYSGRYVVKVANELPMSAAAIGDIWDFSSPNSSGTHLISLRDANGDPIPGLDQVAKFTAHASVPMATSPDTGVNHGTLTFYSGGYYGSIPGTTFTSYGMHWSLVGVCIPETAQAPSGIAAAITLPTEQEAPSGVAAGPVALPTEAQAPLGITAVLVVIPPEDRAPYGITAMLVVIPPEVQAPTGITAVIIAPTEAQAPYGIELFIDTDEDGIPDIIDDDDDGDGIDDDDDDDPLEKDPTHFVGWTKPGRFHGWVYDELSNALTGPFVHEDITAVTTVKNTSDMVCVTADRKVRRTKLADLREGNFTPVVNPWVDIAAVPVGDYIVGSANGAFSYRGRYLSTPFADPQVGSSDMTGPLFFKDAYLAIAETAWMHLGDEHSEKQVHRLDFSFRKHSFGHLWAYVESDEGKVSGQYKGELKEHMKVFTNVRGRRFRIRMFIATHHSHPWNLRDIAVGHLVGKSF